MRRAAVQVLRSARRSLRTSHHFRSRNLHTNQYHYQPPSRPLYSRSSSSNTSNNRNDGLILNRQRERSRAVSTANVQVLQSSMYFRNFGVALVSTLVASGAYYAYKGGFGNGPKADILNAAGNTTLSNQQTRALASSSIFTESATATLAKNEAEAAEATRKALVVEGGQLYTGTIVGDGPLAKDTLDRGRKVLEMLTSDQATQKIRSGESSFHVGRGKGVLRYDVVQLSSNDPIEDDHIEKIIDVPQNIVPPSPEGVNHDWMFWGVFDGHSGWTTSAKLRSQLVSYVARELNSTFSSATNASTSSILPTSNNAPASPMPSPQSIDAAIKRGFVNLDANITIDSVNEVLKSKSKAQAAQLLAPALSGSCALLSFYDSSSKILRVACTGDSRAVLGRRSTTDPSNWIAHPLSDDQTGANPSEAARLRAEHPGEPDVVRVGRVLGGLEPTRAFGDATYKWSKDIQDKMKKDFLGKSMPAAIKTPPYVTAEPVVTTTKVQPERGDFLVLATDGLWECLTNEEVVGLVGRWLERNPSALKKQPSYETNSHKDSHAQGWLGTWFNSNSSTAPTLPVEASPQTQNPDDPNGKMNDQAQAHQNQQGQRQPIRQQQYGIPPQKPLAKGGKSEDTFTPPSSDRFVTEDANVATHLIRNALGGKDKDLMCALLTLPSPYSRRYRDDLTVQVVFFGDEAGDNTTVGAGADANDGITVNLDATAGGMEGVSKPKL